MPTAVPPAVTSQAKTANRCCRCGMLSASCPAGHLQVGQQPLELLRLSTLRDFLCCEFSEFCSDQDCGEGGAATSCSSASSLDGDDGEIDLITGQPRRVHPAAARRRAKGSEAGAPGGGTSSSGGSFYFERILDDVVLCTFLAGGWVGGWADGRVGALREMTSMF